MKKLSLGLLTGAALLTLAACGNGGKDNANGGDKNDTLKIGVLQQVEHGSLDAAYNGFVDGLAELGYKDGEEITIDFQNAQGSQDQLKSISEKLVKNKADLLVGIATPPAQSLLNETTEIPIVVTAVTDLEGAKLVESNEKPGGNLTGTSDLVPIDQQIALLLSVIDNPKTIGLMYNAGEANSKIQAELAKVALEKAGVKVKELTANSTNDVQQVTTSLAKDVDGIYIPTDNTFANAMPIVGEVAKEYKIPVVAGSVEMVEDGGLTTFGLDYYSLGKQTAAMAAKILAGEATPAEMSVETSTDLKLIVNKEMATAIGIDPESIKAPK